MGQHIIISHVFCPPWCGRVPRPPRIPQQRNRSEKCTAHQDCEACVRFPRDAFVRVLFGDGGVEFSCLSGYFEDPLCVHIVGLSNFPYSGHEVQVGTVRVQMMRFEAFRFQTRNWGQVSGHMSYAGHDSPEPVVVDPSGGLVEL